MARKIMDNERMFARNRPIGRIISGSNNDISYLSVKILYKD